MNGKSVNPYAAYVYCDAAMDYDSKHTGGVGLEITFPDFVPLETVTIPMAKYEGANIERLELEAILRGMDEILNIFELNPVELQDVNAIILVTDRYGLNDREKTSPFRIRDWRKNKWHNHEGKAIKNSDLLDQVDKFRKKISDRTHLPVRIEFRKRKFNKTADKLAKKAKSEGVIKRDISLKGSKIGKRKYDGTEVDYRLLFSKSEYIVHIYKKEAVSEQWAISAEFCDGDLRGRKLTIYTDESIERKLHRHHNYLLRIKRVYAHHVIIYSTIRERKILE